MNMHVCLKAIFPVPAVLTIEHAESITILKFKFNLVT